MADRTPLLNNANIEPKEKAELRMLRPDAELSIGQLDAASGGASTKNRKIDWFYTGDKKDE